MDEIDEPEKLEEGDYLGIVSKDRKKVDREIRVDAKDRRDAIRKILIVFWAEKLGNAKGDLIVSDELGEAQYDPDMKCSDVMYNYLPEEVLQRLIEDSDGEFGINPEYPGSGFQLMRLKKKDYDSPEWQSKKKKKSESVVFSAKNWKPGKVRPGAPQKSTTVVPQNLWLNSAMALADTTRGPTVTTKTTFHSKDDRPKGIDMLLRDMTSRGKF